MKAGPLFWVFSPSSSSSHTSDTTMEEKEAILKQCGYGGLIPIFLLWPNDDKCWHYYYLLGQIFRAEKENAPQRSGHIWIRVLQGISFVFIANLDQKSLQMLLYYIYFLGRKKWSPSSRRRRQYWFFPARVPHWGGKISLWLCISQPYIHEMEHHQSTEGNVTKEEGRQMISRMLSLRLKINNDESKNSMELT